MDRKGGSSSIGGTQQFGIAPFFIKRGAALTPSVPYALKGLPRPVFVE